MRDVFRKRLEERENQSVDGLQASNENERSGCRLHVEQLNALKALKDESRIVGRAVGFCT